MIGKVNKLGTGFLGHARYLEQGRKDAVQRDRVDWVESRNLPTRDPQAAARIMAATARDGDSVQPPVYSFSISFDPHDPVSRETMRRVADRTLRDLGLEEHQAVIVAHRDRAHPHVHVMVNRVHPEQHKVWSNWHDYRRIERSLREQEAELGLRMVTTGKHANVPEHARTGEVHAPARLERGDAEFVERVRREAGPHLTGADSWAELERGLAEHGLSVRVEGRGLVVTDGVQKAKASDVDRSASRANLERRLGCTLGEYRARQAVAARTLEERAVRVERAPVAPEPAAPRAAVAPMPAPAPVPPAPSAVAPTAAPESPPTPQPERKRVQVPSAKVEHRRIAQSYHAAMQRLYLDPRKARARFRAVLVQDSREAAVRRLRERPESFGLVRPGAAPAPDRAQDAAREAFRWSGRLEASGRADALRVAGELREQAVAKAFDKASTALATATSLATAARAYRELVRRRVREVARAAGEIYQQPDKALRKLARRVHRDGADRAADRLQSAPEQFGPLRAAERRHWWRGTETDTTTARQRAADAAAQLRGLDTYRATAATAGEVRRAEESVRLARSHMDELRPLAEHVSRYGAEERLTRAGRRLHAWEREGRSLAGKLRPMLPARAEGLLRNAARIGRGMIDAAGDPARERGRDRDRGPGMDF